MNSDRAADDCLRWWCKEGGGIGAGELNSVPGSIGDASGEANPSFGNGNERGLWMRRGEEGG